MALRSKTILWGTFAVVALAAAACGGEKSNRVSASAEPKHAAAKPPPPQAAPPPPAPTQPPEAAPPPDQQQPPPDESEHGGRHGKGKGHGGKGHEGREPEGDRQAKGGEHDKSEKVIHLGHAHMEFNHPGNGWTEKKKGQWTLFHPQDKTSVLGFTEFERPDEATARIGQIASHFELTHINWRGNGEEKRIGKQHLKAHFAEGSCKVASNHHECEIEYYTVEGAVLIVYAFETDVKKVQKKERMATRSVESLRRF